MILPLEYFMTNQVSSSPPTNQIAIISLITALLTVISFCAGAAPIPFTGYVCFPASAFLGIVALITGIVSLKQIKIRSENGRALALTGAWIGGLITATLLCLLTLAILFLPVVINYIHQLTK